METDRRTFLKAIGAAAVFPRLPKPKSKSKGASPIVPAYWAPDRELFNQVFGLNPEMQGCCSTATEIKLREQAAKELFARMATSVAKAEKEVFNRLWAWEMARTDEYIRKAICG